MFDWCRTNRHKECKRKYQRFYIEPKTNKIMWLDEWMYCDCKVKSCPCSKNDAAPVAPVTRKRKK